MDTDFQIMRCASQYAEVHEHDFLELEYVSRGTAEQYIGSKKVIMETGDFLIIDYGTPHRYKSTGKKPLEVINCLFRPKFIDRSLSHCRSFGMLLSNYLIKMNEKNLAGSPSNNKFTDENGGILQLLNNMINEYGSQKIGTSEIIRCMLIELIILTMRTISETDIDKDDIAAYMKQYVADYYMNKIRLSDIAGELHYSVPYLSLKFRNDTGMGFSDFLEKTRIEESTRLLLNTDGNISEISQAVGYNDVNFFYTVFRKFTGTSPAEMRKNNR